MNDPAVSALAGSLAHLATTLELVLMRTFILSELVAGGNDRFLVTAVDELEEAHEANVRAGLRASVVAAEVALSLGLPVVAPLAAVVEAVGNDVRLAEHLRVLQGLCAQIEERREEGRVRVSCNIEKLGEKKTLVGASAGYDRSGRSVR